MNLIHKLFTHLYTATGICGLVGRATTYVGGGRGFDPYLRRPRGVAVDLRVLNRVVG